MGDGTAAAGAAAAGAGARAATDPAAGPGLYGCDAGGAPPAPICCCGGGAYAAGGGAAIAGAGGPTASASRRQLPDRTNASIQKSISAAESVQNCHCFPLFVRVNTSVCGVSRWSLNTAPGTQDRV